MHEYTLWVTIVAAVFVLSFFAWVEGSDSTAGDSTGAGNDDESFRVVAAVAVTEAEILGGDECVCFIGDMCTDPDDAGDDGFIGDMCTDAGDAGDAGDDETSPRSESLGTVEINSVPAAGAVVLVVVVLTMPPTGSHSTESAVDGRSFHVLCTVLVPESNPPDSSSTCFLCLPSVFNSIPSTLSI